MKTKTFDCVRMKNEIQTKLLRQYAGLSDEQRAALIERELAVSASPVAKLWRRLTATSSIGKVAEPPAHYTVRRKK
jgi:hypothetical protein